MFVTLNLSDGSSEIVRITCKNYNGANHTNSPSAGAGTYNGNSYTFWAVD